LTLSITLGILAAMKLFVAEAWWWLTPEEWVAG
jgi:hypothetical protein